MKFYFFSAVTFTLKEGVSKRGGDVLVGHDGHKYTRARTTAVTVTWRCTRRPKINPCPAMVTESRKDGGFKSKNGHNHEPEQDVLLSIDLDSEMRKR